MMAEAVHQQQRAEKIAELAGPLAQEISRAETHLTEMRKELARQQQDMTVCSGEAEYLRDIVERECVANDWPIPETPAEVPLKDTANFPQVPAPRSASEAARQAINSLDARVSEPCMHGECVSCDVPGCVHDCHWLPAADEPAPAGDTRPDSEPKAEAVTAGPKAWLLLIVGLWLARPPRVKLPRYTPRHVREVTA
jgi:hypothetical protein